MRTSRDPIFVDTCLKLGDRWAVLAALVLGAAIPAVGRADEGRWTHYGVRPLAMGNAFVAVADDFNALFYNPAGIARIQSVACGGLRDARRSRRDCEAGESRGALLNLGYEQSLGASRMIREAQALNGKSKDSTRRTIDLIQEEAGDFHRFAVSATPYWIGRPLGVGLGYEVGGSMTAHRSPAIRADVGERAILPVAYAVSLLGNRVSLGAAAKVRFKEGINHTYTLEFLRELESDDGTSLAVDDYFQGGVGMGGDLGLLFTPFDASRATIGVSIADVGATRYYPTKAAGHVLDSPEPVPTSVNIGFSIRPVPVVSGVPWLLALDFHSINQAGSFSRKLNIGTEWDLADGVALQGGFHQGYPCGGLEVRIGRFEARVARYTEEIGEVAGDEPDPRYAVQFKLLI